MLEICIQTLYDQTVQLILKSYLPVVYSTSLKGIIRSRKWNNRHYNGQNIKARYIHYSGYIQTHCQQNKKIKRADQILPEVYGTTLSKNTNCHKT
jgi:hypothetical protein